MDLGSRELFGLPRYFYYLLILAVILWFLFEHTPMGRFMFATGGNPEAARLAGVQTNRLVWGSLVASRLVAGLAAPSTRGRSATTPPRSVPATSSRPSPPSSSAPRS
jgi:ribose transport system permease protein